MIRNFIKKNRGLKTKLVITLVLVGGGPLLVFLFATVRYSFLCSFSRTSCLQHLTAGCTLDGTYEIKAGSKTFDASCDMTTNGGGWTLVANYLHQGKKSSNSALVATHDRLPILGRSSLGDDETGSSHWGHASNTLLASLPLEEVRYKCSSSAHSRVLDFAISAPNCLSYFKTGKGSCADSPEDRAQLFRQSRPLDGHNALLPQRAIKGWRDQDNNALVSYPFYVDYKAHWSPGTADNRWECDDYDSGGKTNTHHQIWIR